MAEKQNNSVIVQEEGSKTSEKKITEMNEDETLDTIKKKEEVKEYNIEKSDSAKGMKQGNILEKKPKFHVIRLQTSPQTLYGVVQLLCADNFGCDVVDVGRQRPLIERWNVERLWRREGADIEKGGFGMGPLLEPIENVMISNSVNNKEEVDHEVKTNEYTQSS
ncbi:hypothetical protein Ccrd_020240 [Cynara cardunculus var. scolymus]|uniref:Uncharacterized protein n=1 Tax=Cynara cardunculus var. scolymus TaxID=59895 RepID=A0A103Y2U3_CYNCS|nr:hypothetical protein Ccrd_020240 [Cynara cardunculus var. scolymus]